jgi:predicted PurR-regulated permease PerM
MDTQHGRWSSQAKLVVFILLLGLGIYLLFRFSIILSPLILAFILSYILTPIADFFQKRFSIRRSLATICAYLLMIVLVVGTLSVLIPLLVTQVSGLNLDIRLFIRSISNLLGRRIIIAGQTIDLANILQQMEGALQGAMEPVFSQTLGLAVEAITSLVWIIFIFVVSFYLVKDTQKLQTWLENLVPLPFRDDYIQLRKEISYIWSAFFRGQIVLALVVAFIFTIIGLVLGLPFFLAMGVFAGLLEFLPSVGHGIWLVTASLLALFLGSSWLPLPNWVFMLIVIGLHLIYEQFDLNYLIPRIIGRSVRLPPLVIILGIVGGAVFAGVLGILLAAPTIASARVLARYLYVHLFDLEPMPTSTITSLPPPNKYWWRRISPRLHIKNRKS